MQNKNQIEYIKTFLACWFKKQLKPPAHLLETNLKCRSLDDAVYKQLNL